jgi:hypothetical protein
MTYYLSDLNLFTHFVIKKPILKTKNDDLVDITTEWNWKC